jgi:hypothetical protein
VSKVHEHVSPCMCQPSEMLIKDVELYTRLCTYAPAVLCCGCPQLASTAVSAANKSVTWMPQLSRLHVHSWSQQSLSLVQTVFTCVPSTCTLNPSPHQYVVTLSKDLDVLVGLSRKHASFGMGPQQKAQTCHTHVSAQRVQHCSQQGNTYQQVCRHAINPSVTARIVAASQAASLAVAAHTSANASCFDSFTFLFPAGVITFPISLWPTSGILVNHNVTFRGVSRYW